MKDSIKIIIGIIIVIFAILVVFVISDALRISEDVTVIIDDEASSETSENEDKSQDSIQPDDDAETQQTVQLYYYNSDLDMDENGNIMCSEKGLVAVERQIPVTQTPIQDTIRLLLDGNLTDEEVEEGVSTEYPLNGFSLQGAALTDGVLTLGFNDPNNETVGGSCRTGILWFQISRTASQFDAVQEVRFEPEELFQP